MVIFKDLGEILEFSLQVDKVDYIIHFDSLNPQEVKALAEDRWKEVETKQAENARSAGWSLCLGGLELVN